MRHEITALFQAAGLPLKPSLQEMLDEHCSHQTERRGCGYTQASRFLAAYINRADDAMSTHDLDIFADWPLRETGLLASALREAGWARGWRALDEAPPAICASVRPSDLRDALIGLAPRVRRIRQALMLPESRLLVTMLEHVLTRGAPPATDVPGMAAKPDIGSCSQAEEFFLEIAHGRVRRHGSVNVLVDTNGAPALLEKMNLGESHSAIVIAPIRINGVGIPVGGLCALSHAPLTAAGTPTRHGLRLPLSCIAEARFLRLTTLALPPGVRERAFSAQVDAQIRSRMLSPTTTTMAELQTFAHRQLAEFD